jgi:hypothetical protein
MEKVPSGLKTYVLAALTAPAPALRLYLPSSFAPGGNLSTCLAKSPPIFRLPSAILSSSRFCGPALGRGQDELRSGDPVGAARISRLGARAVHSRGVQRSAGDGVEISAVRSEEIMTLLELAESELHLEEKTVEALRGSDGAGEQGYACHEQAKLDHRGLSRNATRRQR